MAKLSAKGMRVVRKRKAKQLSLAVLNACVAAIYMELFPIVFPSRQQRSDILSMGEERSVMDHGFDGRKELDVYMKSVVEKSRAFRMVHSVGSKPPDGKFCDSFFMSVKSSIS